MLARCFGTRIVDDANRAVQSPSSPKLRVLDLYSDYKASLVMIELNDLTE